MVSNDSVEKCLFECEVRAFPQIAVNHYGKTTSGLGYTISVDIAERSLVIPNL